ncbi:MAG: carboxyl transferase domain-containing protein [Actinomycetota bacterium]|nr:carboxyl transferase domain-containing protein [Actinomycetota bacterium]
MTNPIALQLRQGTPAHAVAGVHDLDGRPVMLIRADDPEHRGALTPDDGDTLTAAATMALEKHLPIVLLLASSGADANHGVAALDGWGRAARVLAKASGVVPILAGVTGPAVSGTALLIGLADVVVMAEDAYAFVSGPVPVRQMTGVQVDVEELGGASVHYRDTGAASIVVPHDDVLPTISDILRFLPNHNDEEAPFQATTDPVDRTVPEALDLLPDTPTGSYDVRDVIRLVADDEEFLELRAGWAENLVTGLASIGGKPVGVVANQPMAIAGTLDIPASQKGARFVTMCDAFNLPIITFVDTPGFYPGKDLEWRGMIRHGAQMAFAYARATVPRISVVLRKSYGGAFIVMDSKTMGNDAYLAWPTAEIAVMGATQAAQILQRGESDEAIASWIENYEQTYLNPYVGAERGFVDAVIDPAQTRKELADLVSLFGSKRERLPRRRHDNSPL